MNAIKIWKSKKSVIKVEKKIQEQIITRQKRNLIFTRRSTSINEVIEEVFTYSDLQKAIFNNDSNTVSMIILANPPLDLK